MVRLLEWIVHFRMPSRTVVAYEVEHMVFINNCLFQNPLLEFRNSYDEFQYHPIECPPTESVTYSLYLGKSRKDGIVHRN